MPEVGAGVVTIRKEGDTPLEGDVTLAAGTNVTLTQTGQEIEITASGGGAAVPVKEDNVQVVASMSVLDFGSGFDVVESPAGEVNVDLDFAEKAPTHAQVGSVTADQHHAQAHAASGADHTGGISATQHGALAAIVGAHGHDDLDTVTADQHHATEIPSKGGVVLSPAAAINVIIWRAPFACTVTNVRGYRVGGTGATINARLNGASNHLASDLSLTSADTWMDGGAVQNTAYAAGDKLEIMVVTLAGSPTQVGVQVDFTRP